MNRTRVWYLLSLSIGVIGVVLVLVSILESVAAFSVFSSDPLLVGVALAVVGGLMAEGYRRQWLASNDAEDPDARR